MKALVLSGGGAFGAYEAGAAKALLEREAFDLICGVSIGAINAALLACGDDLALDHFWHVAFPSRALHLFPHIPRLRRVIDHVAGIGRGGAWQDALHMAQAATEFPFLRNLGSVHKTTLPEIAAELGDLLDFSRLRYSLLMGATNVSSRSPAVFRAIHESVEAPPRRAKIHEIEYRDIAPEQFVLALLASAAMPGLFSPIELTFGEERALYADGCIVHNSPLGLAIDNGATEITVVFVDPEPSARTFSGEPSIAQLAYNIATLWQQRILDYELRLAQATNEIVRLGGATEKREITIRYVRPEEPLELDMLAFDDAPRLAAAFEQGQRDAAATARFAFPALTPAPPPSKERPAFTTWLRGLFPRFSRYDNAVETSADDDEVA